MQTVYFIEWKVKGLLTEGLVREGISETTPKAQGLPALFIQPVVWQPYGPRPVLASPAHLLTARAKGARGDVVPFSLDCHSKYGQMHYTSLGMLLSSPSTVEGHILENGTGLCHMLRKCLQHLLSSVGSGYRCTLPEALKSEISLSNASCFFPL